MVSTGEIKKQVHGVATQLGGLAKALDTSKTQFEDARRQAEQVVRGSSTDVEANLVGKMGRAAESADSARIAVNRAIEVCSKYADGTL